MAGPRATTRLDSRPLTRSGNQIATRVGSNRNADLNHNDNLYTEALNRFQTLQTRVRQLGLREPDAVTLATVDAQGNPHARVVLLRLVDGRGFAFFTNSQSHKGEQLAQHPHAAICAVLGRARRTSPSHGTRGSCLRRGK